MSRVYAVALGDHHARIIGWAESPDEAVEIYHEWARDQGETPAFTAATLSDHVSFDPSPGVNRVEELERVGTSAWVLSR